jgi:hypothetical protein
MTPRLAIARRRLRNHVFRSPALYLPLCAIKGNRFRVRRDTRLLIEGFPRSANTFVEAALRLSQPDDLRLAHHSHAPASVIWACRRGIPAIVLIRDPVDAVASFLEMRGEGFDAGLLLREYRDFHEAIERYRADFLLVGFSAIPHRLDRLPPLLRAKYGLPAADFAISDAFVARCHSLVDALNLQRNGDAIDRYSPHRDAGFREGRRAALERLRAELRSGAYAAREQAIAVHDRLVAGADLA